MNTNDTLNQNTFSTKALQAIYEAVFRTSTQQPGFYFHDLGSHVNAQVLRQTMVELKDGLSEIVKLELGKTLNFHWMSKFSHQNSSEFHRDNAPEHSFLMLGYEPTKVDSNVYIADYSKYIESQDISLEAFFNGSRDLNLIENNELLVPFVTKLNPFHKSHYRILLLNNSKAFEEKTYGVFHRGEIPEKLDGEERLLNYMMLNLCDQEAEYDAQAINDFIGDE